jgi:hypothetical protein
VANAPKKTAPAWPPKPLPNSTQKNRRCGIVRLLVGKPVAEPGSRTNPLVNASSVVARLLLRRRLVLPLLVAISLVKLFHLLLVRLRLLVRLLVQHRVVRHSAKCLPKNARLLWNV